METCTSNPTLAMPRTWVQHSQPSHGFLIESAEVVTNTFDGEDESNLWIVAHRPNPLRSGDKP